MGEAPQSAACAGKTTGACRTDAHLIWEHAQGHAGRTSFDDHLSRPLQVVQVIKCLVHGLRTDDHSMVGVQKRALLSKCGCTAQMGLMLSGRNQLISNISTSFNDDGLLEAHKQAGIPMPSKNCTLSITSLADHVLCKRVGEQQRNFDSRKGPWQRWKQRRQRYWRQ